MDIFGHVAAAPGPPAAALGPLPCPSPSVRPTNLLAAALGPEIDLTLPNPEIIENNFAKNLLCTKLTGGAGRGGLQSFVCKINVLICILFAFHLNAQLMKLILS